MALTDDPPPAAPVVPDAVRARTPIESAARWTTLLGVALAPSISLGVGDVLLLLALVLRGLQFVTTGVDLRELRRHGILLILFTAVAVGGFMAGVVNGNPMPWELARVIIATLGTVVVVAAHGRRWDDLAELVRALAIGCTFLAITGLVMSNPSGRATGLGLHPNLYGHSLVMGAACAAASFDWGDTRRSRRFWAACAGIQVIGVFLSGSRGSFLALWIAVMLYAVLGRRTRLIVAAGVGTYVGVLLLLLGVLAVPGDSAVDRLLGGGTSSGADLERAEQFDATVELIGEKPIFGDGFERAILHHSVYLQAWASGGAVAGVAVLLLGGAMVLMPFGRPRILLAIPCGAAGIAVAWAFTNIFSTRDQWVFVVLAFRLAQLRASDVGSSSELSAP